MTLYVVLSPFRTATVALNEGDVVDSAQFDLTSLQRGGLAAIPYATRMDAAITAWKQQVGRAAGTLYDRLLAEGVVGSLSLPAAPALRAASSMLIGNTLVWDDVAGAASYDLYRDGTLFARDVKSPVTITADHVGPLIQLASVNDYGRSAALSNGVQFNPRQVATPNRNNTGPQTFVESTATDNVTAGSSVITLTSQSAPGVALSAPASANRPVLTAQDMLGGISTVVFDGVDDYLVSPATANKPKTILLVARKVEEQSNYPIVSYGAAYPYLGKGDAAGGWKFFYYVSGAIQAFQSPVGDEYYRMIAAVDDGADPRITVYNSTFDGVDGTTTVHDVSARPASPNAIALCALPNGTLCTKGDIAEVWVSDQVITAQQESTMLAFFRWKFRKQLPPVIRFVGTLNSMAGAQPAPYPSQHDGQSGDTIASWAQRMVGYWSNGTDFTLGSAGDPGPGKRGAIETLVQGGNTSLVESFIIGANDATGTIPIASVTLAIKRMFAIAQGSLKLVQWCEQTQFNGANVGGLINANVVTYNSLIPAKVAELQAAGYNVVRAATDTGFVPSTMTLADLVHPNPSGCKFVANVVASQLIALGYNLAGNQLNLSGHSELEGGPNLVPQATAQIRPWVAYYLRG